MSILNELHDTISKAADNADGWFEELRGKLPALADAAAKYEASPIVQALEGALLPPAVEQHIAGLINELGKLGGSNAETAPAATTEATSPAEGTDTAAATTTTAAS